MPPIPKLEPLKKVRAKTKRQHAAARKAAVDFIWKRADNCCEKCGVWLKKPRESDIPMVIGHVDELIPRSLGGSDTDYENLRLLCYQCHFSGPSGAHRKTVRRAPTALR